MIKRSSFVLPLLVLACGNKSSQTIDAKPVDSPKSIDVMLDTMSIPSPPVVGGAIDRIGRPLINLVVNDPFDPATIAQREDGYNANIDDTTWATSFTGQLASTLAIIDGLNTVCGDQLLAAQGAGQPMAGRYDALAGELADDRLYVDTSKTTCALYLGLELNAAGLANNDCGGRTPIEDVVDETYTILVTRNAISTGPVFNITDGVNSDADVASTVTFPFLPVHN